jgi:L-rhamnose-H+ transport protein
MGSISFIGVSLVILGALLGGTFALPSKYGKQYPWEMLWGAFFLFATLIFPVVLTGLWSEQLFNTWHQATWAQLLPPVFFGILWGLGSFISGLAFSTAGLSLAYAITMGMQTSFGSTIPLVFDGANNLSSVVVFIVIAGILICLLGVILTGYAGILKDKKLNGGAIKQTGNKRSLITRGIILAIFGGLLAACLNFSFSFGQPVLDIAKVQFSGDASKATLAVWVLALVGGSISSFGYCIYLLIKNRHINSGQNLPIKKLFMLAFIMAVLHDGAIFFYGLGSDLLGKLGPTIGFAIFASGMMLVGNLNGFFTNEWKSTGMKIKGLLFMGLGSIVTGILILAYSNSLR